MICRVHSIVVPSSGHLTTDQARPDRVESDRFHTIFRVVHESRTIWEQLSLVPNIVAPHESWWE